MAEIDLKTLTPDTTLPTTGFLFGADSQAAASPSVYSTQAVATTLLGSTTLTGATVTTSQPVIDASQTWNASGVTFTGLKFNATDTASAAASLLMDLQVGGVSRFNINKNGVVFIRGRNVLYNNEARTFLNADTSGAFGGNSVALDTAANLFTTSTGSFGFASGATHTTNQDTILTRRAAANLRLGAADAAAPVAQTLSVQSVVAGTSNTAGANLTITGSQGTGTGAGGSIIFQVAPAGSSGTAQNALVTALTLSPISGGGQLLASDGSASNPAYSFASQSNTGIALITTNMTFVVGGANAMRFAGGGGDQFRLNGAWSFGWASGDPASSAADTVLRRDAANTLALRNGTNAQLFRVYSTFNGTNDAYGAIGAAVNLDGTTGNANTLYIGSQKKGSPTALTKLAIQVDGTTVLDYNAQLANSWTFWARINSNSGITAGQDSFLGFDGRIALYSPTASILGIGGNTSSFPALKRSSAILQVRLADDTGYTTIDANHRLQGTAPAANNSTGTAGDIRYDADYIYICTATDTWKRVAIATWP